MRAPATLVLCFLMTGCGFTTTKTIVVTATPRPELTRTAGVSTPTAFALTLRDVPKDSMQTTARFHPNTDVAAQYGLTTSQLQQRGRVTSYETEFRRQVVSGMLDIDDVVAAWRTAAGARWDYGRVVNQLQHPQIREVAVHPLAATEIGDERLALSFRSAKQGANITDYAVVFRRGTYRVYLQVVGVTGTVDTEDVLSLARTIDRRIQAAR